MLGRWGRRRKRPEAPPRNILVICPRVGKLARGATTRAELEPCMRCGVMIWTTYLARIYIRASGSEPHFVCQACVTDREWDLPGAMRPGPDERCEGK
jgi:hypothetical protein